MKAVIDTLRQDALYSRQLTTAMSNHKVLPSLRKFNKKMPSLPTRDLEATLM